MDDNKFNTYCSLIFVDLAFTSKKFISKLSSKYRDISDLVSTLTNSPTQQNQEYLQSIFSHNEDVLKKFIKNYITDSESEFSWEEFLDKYEVTPVAGKFFKIEKTQEAYFEFVSNMKQNRWVFSYMSVISEDDFYVIFFA